MPVTDALKFTVGLDLGPFDRGMRRVQSTAKTAGNMIAAAFSVGAVGIGAVATGLAALAKGAVETGAQFESLKTRLGTLMGSAEAGAARMEEIFRFASSTPFELTELVEAEVNLRALGVAAEDVLPMVMDFAGAMGTDLASAAVEVGRAMQFGAGAVETISGRALRAQVELRTGQDALKMSTAQFREELVTTLTDPEGIFAGGTAKLAKTFDGLVSNLSDSWTGFKKQIADAGTFAAAKQATAEILALLSESTEEVGVLASGISGVLVGSLQAGITAVGYLVDAWSLWTSGIANAQLLLNSMIYKATTLADTFLKGARSAQEMLGNDAAVARIDKVRASLASVQMDVSRSAAVWDAESDRLADSFGAGAARAAEINANITAAVDAAKQFGGTALAAASRPTAAKVTPEGGGEGGGGEPGAAEMEAADALAELNDIAKTYYIDRLEGEDAIIARLDEELARIQALAEQFPANAEIEIAAAQAVKEAKYNAELELYSLKKEIADREQAQAQERNRALAAGASDLFSTIAGAAEESARRQAAGHEKAAKRALVIAKAAGIAQALINGALAVSDVWAKWAATPPVAAALSAAATAAVGAQIGIIASQKVSFGDTPGVVEVGGGGLSATFAPGDKVIAVRDIRDAQEQLDKYRARGTVQQASTAAAPAPSQDTQRPVIVVAPMPYKHFDRHWADEVATGGRSYDRVQRMVRQGSSVGQRVA